MTTPSHWMHTDQARAFIDSGESRGTDYLIMQTIAHFAQSLDEAEDIWQNGIPSWTLEEALAFWNLATDNGVEDAQMMWWGDLRLDILFDQFDRGFITPLRHNP